MNHLSCHSCRDLFFLGLSPTKVGAWTFAQNAAKAEPNKSEGRRASSPRSHSGLRAGHRLMKFNCERGYIVDWRPEPNLQACASLLAHLPPHRPVAEGRRTVRDWRRTVRHIVWRNPLDVDRCSAEKVPHTLVFEAHQSGVQWRICSRAGHGTVTGVRCG